MPAGRVDGHDQVVQQHQADLGDQEHAEDLPGQVDPQHTEHGHDEPGEQRADEPRHVEAERGHDARADDAEQPEETDLHERVGRQRDERRPDADHPAQAVADVRVERPGVDDVPAHRDEADREDRQDAGGDEVGHRHGGAADHRVDGGHRAEDDGQRGRAGDAEEHH